MKDATPNMGTCVLSDNGTEERKSNTSAINVLFEQQNKVQVITGKNVFLILEVK